MFLEEIIDGVPYTMLSEATHGRSMNRINLYIELIWIDPS